MPAPPARRVAVVDDYMRVALRVADWSEVERRCAVDVFDRPLAVPDEAAEALSPYEIVCTMRERMAFPRSLFERLPNLRLLAVTGEHHRLLDFAAARDHGVLVSRTGIGSGYRSAAELTWALLLAALRHIPQEHAAMREGGWQSRLGTCLYGRTLGLVGLGNIGTLMTGYARAFGMEVIAWSPNLTPERAAALGVAMVSRDRLFAASDAVSLHLRLSDTSRGLVGARELALMKPTAVLVNTARAPLVEEGALLDALRHRRIAGAALDVYWQEPLSPDHPIRRLDNVVLTPHVGYLTEELFGVFYRETVANLLAYLDGEPANLIEASAPSHSGS